TTPSMRSFFFSSRRRHTRSKRDWSSDVCSSDLLEGGGHRRVVLPDAGGDGPVLEEHLVPGDRELLAVADLLEDGGAQAVDQHDRSEERRVGKGCRAWGWPGVAGRNNTTNGSVVR